MRMLRSGDFAVTGQPRPRAKSPTRLSTRSFSLTSVTDTCIGQLVEFTRKARGVGELSQRQYLTDDGSAPDLPRRIALHTGDIARRRLRCIGARRTAFDVRKSPR